MISKVIPFVNISNYMNVYICTHTHTHTHTHIYIYVCVCVCNVCVRVCELGTKSSLRDPSFTDLAEVDGFF